jgi:Xaa-Pro aminopeptidase
MTEEKEYLHLFSDKDKFNTEECKKHLEENSITIYGYEEINECVLNHTNDHILICDEESLNQNLHNTITKGKKEDQFKIIQHDPVEYTKHIKTEREVKGLRDCNIRDGAALVNYFAWLEKELETRDNITEYEGAKKSAEYRAQKDLFMGESFEAISSSGGNAAIIHYKPDEHGSALITKDNIYLLDSGGQYE